MLKQLTAPEIIAADWAEASTDPAGLAAAFYERLFEMAPETAGMFRGTDMTAQGAKLATALGLVVRHAADPGRIAPQLAALGTRHAELGVERSQYDIVGAALVGTLQDRLGPAFDDSHVTAWVGVYGTVVGFMHPD